MAAPLRRRRALQLGLLAVGLAAVVVSDRTATVVSRAAGPGVTSVVLAVGGFLVGGWALGLALRLQVAPSARGDRGTRLLLGIPCGVLAGWPIVLATMPPALASPLPAWALDLQRVAPFGGAALGVVLALAVVPRGRRR